MSLVAVWTVGGLTYAMITIAIRLRYDYTIRLRRIVRACFQFDASKNEHVNFSS